MKQIALILMGCFAFFTLKSQVDFTANKVCENNMTTLSGSSTVEDDSISAWNWDLDNNGLFDDAEGKTINYMFPEADSFEVGLAIVVEGGGDDTVVKTVVVYPRPVITLSGDPVCQGTQSQFTASTTLESGAMSQFKWDFNGDGTFNKVTSQSSTSFFYGTPGTYSVEVLGVSDKGCEREDQMQAKVYVQPSADFEVEQGKKAGEQVSFSNKTALDKEELQHYLWYFGDGSTAVTQGNVTHTYDSAGSYKPQLVVVTQHSCRDTSVKTLSVDTAAGDGTGNGGGKTAGQTGNVRIITPNADGVNDKLVFEEVDESDNCRLIVYNRWNQLVYESDHYQNDWEGTKNGTSLEAGAYYYRFSCGDSTIIGNVNILK